MGYQTRQGFIAAGDHGVPQGRWRHAPHARLHLAALAISACCTCLTVPPASIVSIQARVLIAQAVLNLDKAAARCEQQHGTAAMEAH